MTSHRHRFIPGAGFRFLTPSYDRVSRLIGLGDRFRAFELRAVGPLAGKRVLDVGCGTGELLRAMWQEVKPARLVGLDPDPEMLAQARAKLRASGVAAELLRGWADALPFPDGSFDAVVSSLMFHHLDAATKRGALREWRRVLAPGGALVLVDFGPPRSALLRILLWPARLGLFEHVAENLRGRVPTLVEEAGFTWDEIGRYGDVVVAIVARPASVEAHSESDRERHPIRAGQCPLVEWVTVYELASDEGRIRAMQDATLGRSDFGVSAKPALVGTRQWWRAIEQGQLPRHDVEGTISKVYWGSMGDWPEFEMVGGDGTRSTWTREGDVSRYVEGLRVRLAYTLHPWKVPRKSSGLGDASKIVLRVEVESSDRRSSTRAPGPGGHALR